jgi:hypothetical protein
MDSTLASYGVARLRLCSEYSIAHLIHTPTSSGDFRFNLSFPCEPQLVGHVLVHFQRKKVGAVSSIEHTSMVRNLANSLAPLLDEPGSNVGGTAISVEPAVEFRSGMNPAPRY